jgi:hypothetical protein
MKSFNVTFTEVKKYKPATRTVLVKTDNEFGARNIIASQFGSLTFNTKLGMEVPSDKKIIITNVVEVKEETV